MSALSVDGLDLGRRNERPRPLPTCDGEIAEGSDI